MSLCRARSWNLIFVWFCRLESHPFRVVPALHILYLEMHGVFSIVLLIPCCNKSLLLMFLWFFGRAVNCRREVGYRHQVGVFM